MLGGTLILTVPSGALSSGTSYTLSITLRNSVAPQGAVTVAYTLNPKLKTLNPQSSTLNPQPSTLNPEPSTLNPQP